MSLTVNRDTIRGKRPVFAKVLELFTGGFGWSARATDRNTTVVELPKGALLRVDEVTRTCHPIKRGRLVSALGSGATGALLEHGSMFQVGDRIQYPDVATGVAITAITERDAGDYILIATATTGSAAAGGVIIDFAGNNVTGTANAFAALPARVEAGASVSVLRRGTVYTNRVQPLTARDQIPTGGAILFSTSS